MQRNSFGRNYLDPRRANNFLDSCAFDLLAVNSAEGVSAIVAKVYAVCRNSG